MSARGIELKHWRLWLRSVHRDAGYVVVGLTFVYALSGLAINHVSQWNPNFREYQKTYELGAPLAAPRDTPDGPNDDEAKQQVLTRLGISETPRDVYRSTPEQLEIE